MFDFLMHRWRAALKMSEEEHSQGKALVFRNSSPAPSTRRLFACLEYSSLIICFIKCQSVWAKSKQMSPQRLLLQCLRAVCV